MANAQVLKLKVKSNEKDGKKYYDTVGTVFVNTDAEGNITSINVKHSMFPNVDMVAWPKKTDDEQ